MNRARALIQQDTLAGWTTENPILEDGVFAMELDVEENFATIRMKKGDSVRHYLDLPYICCNASGPLEGNVLLNHAGTLTAYDSIHDAVTDSVDGDTIILLNDLTLTEAVDIDSKSIAINGNGHNVDTANGAEGFWAHGGKVVKLYGFKKLSKPGTSSLEQRWIVAAGDTDTVLYLDADELYTDEQNIALAYNHAQVFVNARKIYVGGKNSNGYSRKFFCTDRARLTISNAEITDDLLTIQDSGKYIASVVCSGSVGDEDRAHLTILNCNVNCGAIFLHVERGGVGTIDKSKVNCLADMPVYHLCDDLSGDKISKFVLRDSIIVSGSAAAAYYSSCAYAAQNHGGTQFKYQAEFYGINYIEDNGLTSYAMKVFGASPSDFNFKNFGILHLSKPSDNITFDHVAPIVI